MSGDELAESLDRHFLSGCPVLTPRQLRQHRAQGTCTDCSEAGRLAREEDERLQAEYERYACRPGAGGPAVTGGPTPAALAAKAFMERIDGKTYRRAIEDRAILGGWAGAREAGCRDTRISDPIARAAVGAVMDMFRGWAAECGEAGTADTGD